MTDTNESKTGDAGIEAQRAKMSFLFREDVAPGLRLEMDLNKIFTSSESEFQQVDVVETYFGKVCVWDCFHVLCKFIEVLNLLADWYLYRFLKERPVLYFALEWQTMFLLLSYSPCVHYSNYCYATKINAPIRHL